MSLFSICIKSKYLFSLEEWPRQWDQIVKTLFLDFVSWGVSFIFCWTVYILNHDDMSVKLKVEGKSNLLCGL